MALTYTGLDAVTHANIRNYAADNYFTGIPAYMRLAKNNQLRESEGTQIQVPLIYQATGQAGGFSNGGPLATVSQEHETAAVFNYVQKYVPLILPFKDLRQNAGPEGKVKLIQLRTEVARMDLEQHIGADLFTGNQTTSSATNLDGLHLMVDDDDTPKSYGGISTSDMSGWAASNTSHSGSALSLGDIQGWLGDVTIGNDMPTVMFTTQDIFDKIWKLLQADQRFAPAVKGEAGFRFLEVSGVPVFVDPNCQSQTMYMLNEKYVYFYQEPSNSMRFTGYKQAQNTLDEVGHIIHICQLVTDNRRMHHRIDSIDASL